MAICKVPISSLPESESLSGSELIPVVEGIVTKQSKLSELSGFVNLQYVTNSQNTTTTGLSTSKDISSDNLIATNQVTAGENVTTSTLSSNEIANLSSINTNTLSAVDNITTNSLSSTTMKNLCSIVTESLSATTIVAVSSFTKIIDITNYELSGFDVTGSMTVSGDIDVGQKVNSEGLTVDTNTLLVEPSNNRVGINTNTPLSGLDVHSGGLKVTGAALFSAGNVGIDVIDPDQKLEVDGNIKISAERFYQMAGNDFQIGIDGAHQCMQFHAGGGEKVTLLSDGKVGIAVTDPDEKLEVDGNVKISNDRFFKMGGDAFQIGADGGAVGMHIHAGGSEKATLLAGGNFGIGTTNPNKTLTVIGDISGNNSLFISNSATINGPVGIGVTDPDEKLEVDGNIKGNNSLFISNSATINGRVGIGTTTPN